MASVAMSKEAQAIQADINKLQLEIHDIRQEMNEEKEAKIQEVHKERAAKLKELGPKDFWAQVLKCHGDFKTELMGDYDEYILDALEEIKVTRNKDEGSTKIEMTFAQNEYFHDRTLWAQAGLDDEWKTSGVNWKDGKGPSNDDDEDESGEKTEEKSGENKRKRSETGPTFFTFFHDIGPHPEDDDDEELEEMDDEEFDEEVEEYEKEVEDKMEIFDFLVKEVYEDPVGCLEGTYEPGK